jgi:small-conductance mechanosensitive channel
MKKVRSLFESVLENGRVLKSPTPKILMETFGESAVDFRILFWVESMDIYLEVRDEIMSAIFDTFQAHQIEIPFPKRELFIKNLPKQGNLTNENKKSPEI